MRKKCFLDLLFVVACYPHYILISYMSNPRSAYSKILPQVITQKVQ